MRGFDLIVPFAARQKEMPFLLEGAPETLPFAQALSGIMPEKFEHIFIALLAEDDRRLEMSPRIRESFAAHGWEKRLEIVSLPEATTCEAETIAETLERTGSRGSFWVKDPDNFFRAEPIPENVVTAFPLDALVRVNPQNKSYLAISDGDYILNIAEKRVIGRHFCTGGYGFAKSEEFLATFRRLKNLGRLYISHIIYRMLLDDILFRPLYVSDYQDWGSREDWLECNGQ